jgi:hypothetical protein
VNLRQLASRLARYGVSIDDWATLTGDGRCPICLRHYSDAPARRAVLDHDHATGEARGALCAADNWWLGTLGDDVEKLARAVEYLRHPPAADLPGAPRRAFDAVPKEN